MVIVQRVLIEIGKNAPVAKVCQQADDLREACALYFFKHFGDGLRRQLSFQKMETVFWSLDRLVFIILDQCTYLPWLLGEL